MVRCSRRPYSVPRGRACRISRHTRTSHTSRVGWLDPLPVPSRRTSAGRSRIERDLRFGAVVATGVRFRLTAPPRSRRGNLNILAEPLGETQIRRFATSEARRRSGALTEWERPTARPLRLILTAIRAMSAVAPWSVVRRTPHCAGVLALRHHSRNPSRITATAASPAAVIAAPREGSPLALRSAGHVSGRCAVAAGREFLDVDADAVAGHDRAARRGAGQHVPG